MFIPDPAKTPMEPAKLLRRMGGVFQRLPRALQKMPVLRIHDGGVARAEAEERRVEERHAVENRGAAHVVGVGEILGRCAGGEQFRVRQVADGFDAVAQIPPELGGVARAGKTARHADDRDGRRASWRCGFPLARHSAARGALGELAGRRALRSVAIARRDVRPAR